MTSWGANLIGADESVNNFIGSNHIGVVVPRLSTCGFRVDKTNSIGNTVAMPRQAANPHNKKQLAAHLAALQSKMPTPAPSFPEMSRDIRGRFHIAVTDETLRKMHVGEVDPATTNPEYLIAVAKFYGVSSSDLGPVAEERLANLLALTQNWKKLSPEATAALRRQRRTRQSPGRLTA